MKKVLVVDNDEMILTFMEEVLSDAGHEVITARTGLEAMDILGDYAPDIVFVDLVMPNINGEKLCKVIRKMHIPKQPLLVVLSAIAAEGKTNLSDLGADACIAKAPLDKMKKFVFQVIEESERMPSYSAIREPLGLEGLSPRGIIKELLSIKNRYEAISEKMSEGIFEVNADGRILYANPVAQRISGMPEEELLGSEFAAIFSDNDRGRIERMLGNVGEIQQNIGENNPLIVNSYLVTIKLLSVPVSKGAMVILEDVTERKRREQELRESEERFRSMVNLSSDGILLVEEKGYVRFANPASEKILGRNRSELLGSKLDLPLVCNRTTEVNFRRGETDRIVAEISVAQVEWENETSYLVSLRDITGRREMEEELIMAQKLESLGLLAGGLAHDFNNLLTGILGNIELAETRAKSGKEGSDRLAEAKKEVFRARDLVNQLVTFAQDEALEMKIVPLGELIQRWAVEALSELEVSCSFSVEKGLWHVEADERHIKKAISNVLLNGAEATAVGGSVKLSAVNMIVENGQSDKPEPLEAGHYIRITVEDEGRGIPRREISSIFDPYFSKKKRGKRKGVGLGLTTAYYAVRNHGGHINVQSQKDVGTKVDIYLPAIVPET